jgi:phosphohistidine phosphatase
VKTLVVVRHGKSDWTTGVPDRERPLNARGKRQAVEAGLWLVEHVPAIDRVVVSPAERARATWALIAPQFDSQPETVIDERMYGGRLPHVVAELPDFADTAALIGHNPDLEELIEQLTGDLVEMPTSCVAVLKWPGSWVAGVGAASLVAHGRPPH